jgi:hypothetical protein
MFKIFSCGGRIYSPTIVFQKKKLFPKFASKTNEWKKLNVTAHSSKNSLMQLDEIKSINKFQPKNFSKSTQWKNEEFFGFFHESSSVLKANKFFELGEESANQVFVSDSEFIDSKSLSPNQKFIQNSLDSSKPKNGNSSNLRYSSRNIVRILFAFFFDHSKKNLPLGSFGRDKTNGKIISSFDQNLSTKNLFQKLTNSPREVLKYLGKSLPNPPEKLKDFQNKTSRGIRNLTSDESFPSLRIHQRKIPLLPFFFCFLPYILFLGIRQSFSLLSSSNSLEDFLLLKNPLFPIEKTSLTRILNSNTPGNDDGNMERKIRRFMSSHKAFSQLEQNLSQNKSVEVLVNKNHSFENQNWILSLPSSLSKFFVIWAIQKIASIRPQRRMTEKAEQSQQARILFPHEISVKFENLQGLTGVLPLLNIFIESLHSRGLSQELKFGIEKFQKKKVLQNKESKYPKGYLFVGPPGTGKTQLAQALAKEANVPLLCVSASEIQKQIEIGTRIGGLRLRKVFEKAREYAPCILFFDEIDAIGKTRGQQGSGDSQLLTEFLIQMDSFSVRDGFVVVGTTNFLSNLDSAFIRSGRFDRILNLHSPSKKIRLDILQSAVYKKNLENKKVEKTGSPKIPWKYFAHYTEDFSPAHLARLVNESFLYSCEKSISSFGVSQNVFGNKVHHSFESLQHGFHRIQNHRKNFL